MISMWFMKQLGIVFLVIMTDSYVAEEGSRIGAVVKKVTLCENMKGICQKPKWSCPEKAEMKIYNKTLSEKYCNVRNRKACCAPSGQVFIADIENSLSFALRNTILFQIKLTRDPPDTGTVVKAERKLRDSTTFNDETVDDLRKFLGIIVKYLKYKKRHQHIQKHTRSFIKKIFKFINRNRYGLTSKMLLEELNKIQNRKSYISPVFRESVSCHNIVQTNISNCYPNFWLYTCGLWNTFHTLTHAASANNADDPLEVLEIIKGFVIGFHGCSDCTAHFREMYSQTLAKYPDSVNTNKDAILWLWCAHNAVNHRFTYNPTNDPKYWWPPHPQFPLKTVCPECWATKRETTNCKDLFCDINIPSGNGTCFQTPDDDSTMDYEDFNRDKVLKNLKGIYGVTYNKLKAKFEWSRLGLDPKQENWTNCPNGINSPNSYAVTTATLSTHIAQPGTASESSP